MSEMWTVERLAELPELEEIPRAQLRWLLENGEVLLVEDGARFYRLFQDLSGVFIMLSGRFSVRVDQEGVEREVREVRTGGISGHLPYSRLTTPRGYLVADGPVQLLLVPESKFREMTRECYEFTAKCVHAMLDRVRDFKGDDKQREKMASLGRLSAGLAHELNNPTAAVGRAARELDATRHTLISASRALGAARLAGPALAAFEKLEESASRAPGEPRSPMEQADMEDRLIEWLEAHDIDGQAAYPLARTSLSEADLAQASGALDRVQLGVVVSYLGADAAMRQLAGEIGGAAGRIHALVAAVKKHTHMDQPTIVERVQLEGHLADTVTLMRSKADTRNVSLRLRVAPDLPAVSGTVVELNQVWMHLVDNAIDAAADSGVVSIEASAQDGAVRVQVVDDGPGIPDGDQERVFEPFFTKKDVGRGRGLGLDIVQTVVRSHRGSVTLESCPGRTVFTVTLPAAEP